MIFVIREAFIDLSACDIRETTGDNAVHRFAILEQADDVVNSDARAFEDGLTTAYTPVGGAGRGKQ